MGLKDWTEYVNFFVIINEVICEFFVKYVGEILKFLGREVICSDSLNLLDGIILLMNYNIDIFRSFSVFFSFYFELYIEVLFFVLILGLFVVFILFVCFGVGLFVFVLKRRKGVLSVFRSVNNLDVSFF